jgi:hypothetical protein
MYKGIGKMREPTLGMGSNVLEREMQGNMGKRKYVSKSYQKQEKAC